MTVSALDIYLVAQCDKLSMLLLAIALLSTVGVLLVYLHMDERLNKEYNKFLCRWGFRCMVVAFVSWPVFCVMPNSRTVAAMLVVPKIVNSDIVPQDIPAAVKQLIHMYLDKAEEKEK